MYCRQLLLESLTGVVAKFAASGPSRDPTSLPLGMACSNALGTCLAGFTPAAVGLAESLVEHVDVKSVDSVGQLLGNDLLHRFQVARVEAEAANRIAVRRHAFATRDVRARKCASLLHDAVRNESAGRACALPPSLRAMDRGRASPGAFGSSFEL